MKRFTTIALLISFWGCNSPAPELPVLGEVPDFRLTERSGQAVSRADLLGQPWVANFVFTTCMGPCPLLSSQMSKLHKAAPDSRLVSFSVDPETDTPAVLRDYAEQYNADPERRLFLTGEKQRLYELILRGFMLAVDQAPPPEGAQAGPGLITHSVRFVLVDGRGRIRAYYDGVDPDLVDKILPDLASLYEPAEE